MSLTREGVAGSGLLSDLYLTTSRAYLPRPAAGGGLWFASDLPGHAQLYRLDSPGAWPVRVAPSSHRTLPIAHTERGLLVRQDRGGNETWQLALVTDDGGWRPLTRDARAIHQSVRVAPDGGRAGLAYNPGGQDDFVLAVLDLETGDLETWLDRSGMWGWSAWSPDGGEAAVEHVLSPTRVESYRLRPGGEPERLLPEARRTADVTWAGDRLLALTDLDAQFMRLADAVTGEPLHAPEGRDVTAFVPDPTRNRVLIVENAGAYDELAILDLGSARVERLEPPAGIGQGVLYTDNVNEAGANVAWTDDGRLLVAWETPVAPADVYEWPRGTRWTLAGDSAPPSGRRPEAVSYRSFDGLEVPALLYSAEPGAPTVVNFHGGPEGQSRGNFMPFVQLFVEAGLNVLLPNVRGSTGYGERYFSLDDRELRWDAVRDGCAAARWVRQRTPDARVAAMGGSYGGFMTLAVLVEEPELWDAAVDIVGIADWHTFFRNTSGWRRALRAAEYGDPQVPADAEFLAEFSPLRRAGRIRADLLVIHGRNDVRVPVGEAEQIAAATGAELMVFDDEGHGIARHGNRVRAYGRALDFLLERLL